MGGEVGKAMRQWDRQLWGISSRERGAPRTRRIVQVVAAVAAALAIVGLAILINQASMYAKTMKCNATLLMHGQRIAIAGAAALGLFFILTAVPRAFVKAAALRAESALGGGNSFVLGNMGQNGRSTSSTNYVSPSTAEKPKQDSWRDKRKAVGPREQTQQQNTGHVEDLESDAKVKKRRWCPTLSAAKPNVAPHPEQVTRATPDVRYSQGPGNGSPYHADSPETNFNHPHVGSFGSNMDSY